ncbi:fimbria/pilus outer membrane usher protein, partial [Klebsiella pneumoniae]|nr:fimbria/pilus outer membrane usher protein [Klebsiella pneumoniae]
MLQRRQQAVQIASWAETNIIPWRSRLVVGQTSTDNSVFVSVGVRSTFQADTDVLRQWATGEVDGERLMQMINRIVLPA